MEGTSKQIKRLFLIVITVIKEETSCGKEWPVRQCAEGCEGL